MNSQGGFLLDSLVNKGKGKNLGIELTLEKFLSRGSYYLISASLYDSKYKTPGDRWRNTRFNANHTLAVTAGKDFELSEKRKNRIIGISFKTLYSGGLRVTPLDERQSQASGEAVYFDQASFALQNPDYLRVDIRISLRRNRKKITETVSLDLQNDTNRKNLSGTYFDPYTGKTKKFYGTPLIPVFSYKVQF